MGDKTGIEWTDATWNPVRGCSRVSEGCRHCYAERVAARFSGAGQPYEGLAVMGRSGPRWTGQVRMVEDKLLEPLRWQKPRRIFVNSMSDLFHESLEVDDIVKVFAVMALAQRHTFQVLTKRPERMAEILNDPAFWRDVDNIRLVNALRRGIDVPREMPWPLPNVWLGTSVEDQRTADERIPLLLQVPAVVRFISAEPLLGPVDLSPWVPFSGECYCQEETSGCRPGLAEGCPETGIHWVIVGGESGPHARPVDPDWARDLRDQCVESGTPYFFKQWGEWVPVPVEENRRFAGGECVIYNGRTSVEGGNVHLWDGTRASLRVGKKHAGRLLDGREWSDFPDVRGGDG